MLAACSSDLSLEMDNAPSSRSTEEMLEAGECVEKLEYDLPVTGDSMSTLDAREDGGHDSIDEDERDECGDSAGLYIRAFTL